MRNPVCSIFTESSSSQTRGNLNQKPEDVVSNNTTSTPKFVV